MPSPDLAAEASAPRPPPARALLRHPDFVLFWLSRVSAVVGSQVQSVSLGWQVYALARRTHDVNVAAFDVSLIGLASFVPVFLLALPAGETADRHDRRAILLWCLLAQLATAAALAGAAWTGTASVPLLLGIAAGFGAARAFSSPAGAALGPMLVPRPLLPRAIAMNSLAWQSASILGPALGGVLVAISPALSYAVAGGLYALSALAVLLIRAATKPQAQAGSRLALMREGLAFVWRNRIVFGSISLDLFAVLLGGATALLPVFARDVLHVGAAGFGLLRAGPAMGATVAALALAAWPIHRRAGLVMFGGVAVFGLATVVFSLSKLMWLSVAALAVLGAADMLSVYVRATLEQLSTPDAMRGRVATVSSVFVGASNELGEFESGLAARVLGPIGAALFGGLGALVVTGLWAWLFPELRKADRLT